jgi:DNA-binding MarR family transcriptional regulator
MMTDTVRTKVAVDLLSIPPLLFRGVRRKLFKRSLVGIDINITPIHYEILQLVEEKGPLHIAEIGLRLQIAKAQMTQLLNRLVDAKLVERKSDPEDRRVANISITENGKSILIEHRNSLVASVEDLLAGLSEKELEELSVSLKKLQDVLTRLQ